MRMENPMARPEMKTNYWKEMHETEQVNPVIKTNRKTDVISIFIAPQCKEKIIVYYVDELVALLYRHSDNEIVGFRVEAFEKCFLPKYSALEKAWKLSDNDIDIENFGDLELRFTTKVPSITKEMSKITTPLFSRQGIELTPIPA